MVLFKRCSSDHERGAALVTVLLITALLLTATVALLTSLGSGARNTTDVLSETKAYYAAESGIQATINQFRNVPNDATFNYQTVANDNTVLTSRLYNWPTSGGKSRAVVGTNPASYDVNRDTAYSISISDPDNSGASTTFTTVGGFAPASGATFVTSRTFGTSPNTITVSYTGISTPVTFAHPGGETQNIGYFTLTTAGTGATIPTGTRFSIDYVQSAPRPGYKSFGGTIQTAGPNVQIQFDAASNVLLGATIQILGLDPSKSLNLTMPVAAGTPANTQMSATIGPTEPYRLVVDSTGYGPTGAQKQLEAILQRNLFNSLAPGAATSIIGASCPVGQTCFAPGTSNGITYNGCSAIGCVASFAVTDPTNLAYIQSHPPGGDPTHMTPPPVLLTQAQMPSWQSSPQALDALVDQLRVSAQSSGRYFVQPSGNLTNPGNWTNGTGITFCEGSCKVSGSGGGVLVVTGQLTNVGDFNFKGMIIVTGAGGWLRNGGGTGQIIGNIVIAPYNMSPYVPENLSATFLPPIYQITGGGSSDVIYGDVAADFDNTSVISDFVAGVAEK